MEEQVVIEVTSAIVVEGLVVPPGQAVQVLASDARTLIAQGKAVRVEGAEPEAPEEGGASKHATPKTRAAKAR